MDDNRLCKANVFRVIRAVYDLTDNKTIQLKFKESTYLLYRCINRNDKYYLRPFGGKKNLYTKCKTLDQLKAKLASDFLIGTVDDIKY